MRNHLPVSVWIVLAAGLLVLIFGCAPAAPAPQPKYKAGDVVQFVMGGQPGHVLFVFCSAKRGCLYDVRAFSYRDAPRVVEYVREWELNPGK